MEKHREPSGRSAFLLKAADLRTLLDNMAVNFFVNLGSDMMLQLNGHRLCCCIHPMRCLPINLAFSENPLGEEKVYLSYSIRSCREALC